MTQAEPIMPALPVSDSDSLEKILLSHDVLTALGQVLGGSQVLEAAKLDAVEAAHLARIRASALFINDLLTAALGVSRESPVTELKAALADLEAIWLVEAKEKEVQIEITVEKGVLPLLHLPRLNFLRIFNNIIGNALKFSGAGRLDIRLSRIESNTLKIEVIDNGPGFSEAALEQLFSLQGRPQSNEIKGTGYGLYIAHSLVNEAGGDISAKNRPAGGARVTVMFPEDLQMASAPSEAPEPRAQRGLPDLSHLNILLAEDNPTNQLVATQMLKKMDATIVTASDGVEAMALFESGDFNLGLIDIEMPRKSGLEVLREMRGRHDEKANMTLLALTAYVLPEHKERITAAGADGIIAKPLTDIATFGNAILIFTGEAAAPAGQPTSTNPDAEIQQDIYAGLKEIIGHDSMLELLGKVESDLEDVRAGLLQGVQDHDIAPIRAKTHILISVAGAIGAVKLQHIAEDLNATAKSENWSKIEPDTAKCEAAVKSVLGFVVRELNS